MRRLQIALALVVGQWFAISNCRADTLWLGNTSSQGNAELFARRSGSDRWTRVIAPPRGFGKIRLVSDDPFDVAILMPNGMQLYSENAALRAAIFNCRQSGKADWELTVRVYGPLPNGEWGWFPGEYVVPMRADGSGVRIDVGGVQRTYHTEEKGHALPYPPPPPPPKGS
jgi:hypothetical protein